MDEQKLNKKLAEFLFPPSDFLVEVGDSIRIERLFTEEARLFVEKGLGECVLEVGTYYHHETISDLFTQSLDACFKWLVPKLSWFQLNNWNKKKEYIAFVGVEEGKTFDGKDKNNPALALCLAIEKLIRGNKGE